MATSLSRPRRALITGATSGIGLAYARALAKRGVNLVLLARDADRLASCADELSATGIEVETLACDLGTTSGLAQVSERLAAPTFISHDDAAPAPGHTSRGEHCEPIDMVINNAGRGLYGSVSEGGEAIERHLQAMDLMVRAPLVISGMAAHYMAQRGGGYIVNISSVSSLVPMGNYSAIKAWLRVFSRALDLEVDPSVSVHSVLPGWVRTEFHERAGARRSNIPDFLWLSPDQVAEQSLIAIARGKRVIIPTYRYRALSFLASHAPRRAVEKVVVAINKGRS